jgi:hypothetical protein
MGAITFIQEQSDGRGAELRRDQVRKHVERSDELRPVWQSDPAGLVVVEEPKKERVVRPLLKKPKHELPRPEMPPLKQPKPEIIVPQWVEDEVRKAIDRDGGILDVSINPGEVCHHGQSDRGGHSVRGVQLNGRCPSTR